MKQQHTNGGILAAADSASWGVQCGLSGAQVGAEDGDSGSYLCRGYMVGGILLEHIAGASE